MNRLFFLFLTFSFISCSPFYVIRAGYEEAKILIKRKDIKKLVDSSTLEQGEKEKLVLVLDVRDYAKSINLKVKNSFTKYTKLKKKNLVWVITACPKNSLKPKTWWFPIVGSVPYKGFFSKKDAESEAKKLNQQGYEVFLRPSNAFSTLGWFNDPILSTTLDLDEITITETIFHELLHNTIWIKDHAIYNETMANYFGQFSAIEYFKGKNLDDKANQAKSRLTLELAFSKSINHIHKNLTKVYETNLEINEKELKDEKEKIIKESQKLFSEAIANKNFSNKVTSKYDKVINQINNASLLAYYTYLKEIDLFDKISNLSCQRTSSCSLLDKLEYIKNKSKELNLNSPYDVIRNEIKSGKINN